MPRPTALACLACVLTASLFAQSAGTPPSSGDTSPKPPEGLKQRETQAVPGVYQIDAGTHILLSMINSISTKQAAVGDRIYLETAFPVLSDGRIVIPQGSWVTGTVTEVKRPGRVKGRGSLQVRFDSLTLPNGVSKNFRSDLGALDGRSSETLQRETGKINGPGDKKGDAGTIIGASTAGTVIGSGVGAAAGSVAHGAGIGAGAGAAAGLIGVLTTRGPDATLTKGSTVEMVLDRSLSFDNKDLDFGNAPPRGGTSSDGPGPQAPAQRGLTPRIPF